MSRIGKVSDIPWKQDFEWKIEDFSTLPAVCDEHYFSPSFSFAGVSWFLQIFPKGEEKHESIEYVGLYLIRGSSGPPIRLDCSLILKTMDETTKKEVNFSFTFEKAGYGKGRAKFVKRSEFLERESEIGQRGSLTVICTMKYVQNTDDGSEIVTANCSFCKEKSDANYILFHEARCLEKPLKCPECCDVFKLKDWYDHECQRARSEAFQKLSDDFKEMMVNGNYRNTTIKVKGVEIALHSDILAARNPYFHSMFKNDMKEKNTGVVSIDDCEPDIFRTLVHFIYSGKADKLSEENVCNLFETAEKYQEDHLKKECLYFMMKTLSVDTFCDYIVLALKYDEKKLFEKTVDFFTSKPKEIVSSVKWQVFSKEYNTEANELFLKILDKHY